MAMQSQRVTNARGRFRAARVALALIVGPLILVGCGGSDGPPLTPLAAEGRDIMRDSGCAACHGRNGAGGVGPSWTGLYGSTVELEGGSRVAVDEDYLRRSIVEPEAEKVSGYTVTMPDNNLTVDEVDAVLAYIEALR